MLRIGTRGSALALWQAHRVANLIAALPNAPPTTFVEIRTTGDTIADVPLWQVEGKSFFTKELDDALLDGRVDLAVHSLKDVATRLPEGLTLAAVPEREDPRDALVARQGIAALADLPRGAVVGTSSVRRRAFLRHARPDIEPAELRGNVPTRIRFLDEGRYDAVILAVAGLKRLGLAKRISAHLDTDAFPPAAAQGALGICARAGDAETLRWLTPLEAADARLATQGERAFLHRLEGGCQIPAGVLADVKGGRIHFCAAFCEPDGSGWQSARQEGAASAAEALGESLADRLVNRLARPA